MENYTGFTIHRDPNIDSQLMEQMKIIRDEIIKTYKKIYSIILAGGFGRGEGSIKILKNGKIVPLKDYDIYVVTDHKISESEYINMINRIHERIAIKSSWYFSVGPGEFNVGIQAIPLRKLERLPPDIATVDLKTASKVIYGDDLRGRIPLSPNDVILSSGALVLFNKTIGLLEQMDPRLFTETLENERKHSIVYVCGKTFIEMCTALTILAKQYVPSYSKRAETFARIFAENFPDLLEKIPDLPTKVAFFTELKLKSNFDEFKVDPIELWFVTRRYFNEVLQYYMQYFLNMDSSANDWFDFSEKLHRKLGFEFFKEYIHCNLRNMTGYHPRLLPFLSIVGQVYDNFFFVNRVRSIKKKLYVAPILSWRSPLIKIFSASTLALNAINQDGSIDDKLLRKAISYIKKAYPVKTNFSSLIENWNAVRKACIESQKLYFTRKEIIAI
jgi:hypothetical protein